MVFEDLFVSQCKLKFFMKSYNNWTSQNMPSSFWEVQNLFSGQIRAASMIPLFIYRIGLLCLDVGKHDSIEKPTANNYFDLVNKFIYIILYSLIFRTLYFQKDTLTVMLNHISNTATTLERKLANTSKRFVINLQNITFSLIFLTRIVLEIIWFV